MSNPAAKKTDRQERLQDALAWCLSTEQGRRFLFHLVYAAAKLEQNAFTTEKLSTEYNLGQQSVGRWLLEFAEQVEPTLADKMIAEGRAERRTDRIHAEPDASS